MVNIFRNLNFFIFAKNTDLKYNIPEYLLITRCRLTKDSTVKKYNLSKVSTQ